MSDHTIINGDNQADLFEEDAARSLLDQLLEDSRLYRKSSNYMGLLNFTIRMRNFAPFNAMLLDIQKPGLRFAASAKDWRERYHRTILEDARPLLILWPFGPVALVYDVMDTEGKELPRDVAAFYASGYVTNEQFSGFERLLEKKNIQWQWFDAGDNKAGNIRVVHRAIEKDDRNRYLMKMNRNHSMSTQFATLAHELGHLFLGHLGKDKKLNIPSRPSLTYHQHELEAESVSYLVCKRNGVDNKSETYLNSFVDSETTIEDIDIYQVMRAAGQVEATLKLTAHTSYDQP